MTQNQRLFLKDTLRLTFQCTLIREMTRGGSMELNLNIQNSIDHGIHYQKQSHHRQSLALSQICRGPFVHHM
jgi:hypothetical protein